MRAVFVNHCHPDTPHVCAVRLREFANALAKQGHRIVLLTATLGPDDRVLTPVEVGAALETHDWSRPFLIACRPAPAPLTEALQEHDLMPGIRQMVVLWCFLAKGGVFWNWTAASEPLWPVLAESFRPDAVWATLGNLDALNIARGIAGIAGCPWVMDIKDPWRNAIPRALRAVIAGRYRDAAAITGIFDAHIADVESRFAQTKTVIHSGFPARFIVDRDAAPGHDDFRILLCGSVYDGRDLETVIGEIASWASRRGAVDATPITFTYAGSDRGRVEAALKPLAECCRIELHEFLELEKLRRLQLNADVNLYIKGRSIPFHHKFMELLCAAAPIISFPHETEAILEIARTAKARFYSCGSAGEVAVALDDVWNRRADPPVAVDHETLRFYSWENQADRLLRVFEAAITRT